MAEPQELIYYGPYQLVTGGSWPMAVTWHIREMVPCVTCGHGSWINREIFTDEAKARARFEAICRETEEEALDA